MTKKEAINQIINSVVFVILIGILLLLKTFLFYNSTIATNEALELNTIVGTISFLVVLGCFIIILPNRARIVTTIIINIVISVLLFGDHVYYIYSNSVLSVAQISNLQYGGEIMKTLPMVIQAKQILYFLDILILIGLFLGKVVKLEKKEKATKNQITIKAIIAIVGIIIFCLTGTDYVQKEIGRASCRERV